VVEGRTIEYKEQLPGGADDDKREFLADASSFANAGGGDLIFGVRENRDAAGKPTGIPEATVGLAGSNADGEMRRLEDMLRAGIDPRIPAIRIKHVDGFPSGPVILLRVPKSWASPHMVIFKNLSRFFSRTSAGKHQLDVREIRAAFLASEGSREKIRRFRDERLARIVADEMPVILHPNPKVIVHVIPLTFPDEVLNLGPLLNKPAIAPPLNRGIGHNYRVNFDGFLTFTNYNVNQPSPSYLQIFRSGAFETVDTGLLNPQGDRRLINVHSLEMALIDCINNYMSTLRDLGLNPPFLILIALHKVAEYRIETGLPLPDLIETHPVDRPTLLLPDILIEEFAMNVDKALRPAFDATWQSMGLPASLNYAPDGSWDGGESAKRRRFRR